jgi:hypothetical protein
MIKRLLTILVVGVLLVSCSNDEKKVRAKRYYFSGATSKYTTSINVEEIVVDTIFHIGDTVQQHREMYIIVK